LNLLNRFAAMVLSLRDRIQILRLRQQIARIKLRNYDLLSENVVGLRRALETQQRQVEDLQSQLEQHVAQIENLRAEYSALQLRQAQSGSTTAHDERLSLFKRLQVIATQLPTMRAALESGADLKAHDVIDMLRPFDQMLMDLDFQRIGDAGQEADYNPTRHKAVGRGAASINAEDRVRVRYVGYLYQGDVVCKAEVTLLNQPETANR
jgi:molecular chaperone GrpE (heat shock protein)